MDTGIIAPLSNYKHLLDAQQPTEDRFRKNKATSNL